MGKTFPQFTETADIETASSDYARRFGGKIGKYFLEVQTKAVLELFSPWPGAKVLDVGGGHAQVAAPLVKNGFDVTVVGSSEACRNQLDILLGSNSFNFKCCDMLALPFEENSFDVVLAFRLLPHVDQWRKLIKEMCRVSKRAIIIDYPDIRSFNFISNPFFKIKVRIEGNTLLFQCFSRKEILSEFSKSGFYMPIILPEFFIPMVIHRAIGIVLFSKVIESLCRLLGLTTFLGSPVVLRVSSVCNKNVKTRYMLRKIKN